MALSQCSTRTSTASAGLRSSPALAVPKPVCSAPRVVRSVQLAPNSASCSGRAAAIVVRAASTKEQEAQARWTQQVKDGIVMNVSNKTAGEMMAEGWVLLDVRPPSEVEKVGVKGAVSVPLYLEDPSNSVGSLIKKAATVSTGGWWLGGTHMIPNQNFLAEVQAKIPKDSSVVVGCQKGLRSLAAAEQLSRAGYSKLAWINGGFDTARPEDLPTTNDKDIRFAGIGGLSEALGWTEVQQEYKQGQFAGGFENILKLVALVLVADLALFGWEYIQYLTGSK